MQQAGHVHKFRAVCCIHCLSQQPGSFLHDSGVVPREADHLRSSNLGFLQCVHDVLYLDFSWLMSYLMCVQELVDNFTPRLVVVPE